MPFQINPYTLDFDLPEELIAQEPTAERDQARLLLLHRESGKIEHKRFFDLPDYLRQGDVLVLNRAKVSKTKMIGKKATGGKQEVIFLSPLRDRLWKVLLRPAAKEGIPFNVENLTLRVQTRFESGEYAVEVVDGSIEEALASHGLLPLPPYIKREEGDARTAADEINYQTVFADRDGSVAAPTAGLHFSQALLNRLTSLGVERREVLLNVGWGTFKPILSTVEAHRMLAETYEIPADVFEALNLAKKEGRRIVAVGTTSTRTLESLPMPNSMKLSAAALGEKGVLAGETSLFIRPGFQFHWVDALITNLHVPRSTPVSLTATFAGLSNLEKAYEAAIHENYRFFSYGDAMLIL